MQSERVLSASSVLPTSPAQLARYIDHTHLKADATYEEIEKLCREAKQYGFASVCVNSSFVRKCWDLLTNTEVLPICVVGFPLGAAASEAKAFETAEAIRNGAKEIDTVIHVGALKSGDFEYVQADIAAVTLVAQKTSAKVIPVKVIIETAQLSREEKITACTLAKAGGAQFVKTCTGFGGGKATVEDIVLMRSVVGPDFGVKASGGIKTLEAALELIGAGASRLGTSSGVALVTEKMSLGKGITDKTPSESKIQEGY